MSDPRLDREEQHPRAPFAGNRHKYQSHRETPRNHASTLAEAWKSMPRRLDYIKYIKKLPQKEIFIKDYKNNKEFNIK